MGSQPGGASQYSADDSLRKSTTMDMGPSTESPSGGRPPTKYFRHLDRARKSRDPLRRPTDDARCLSRGPAAALWPGERDSR